jgi:hypothetical protein
MARKFPGSQLEIMPVCLGSINVNDTDLRFLNSVTVCGFANAPLRYFINQFKEQKGEYIEMNSFVELLNFRRWDRNAIGLQFKSPFYVDANCLLVFLWRRMVTLSWFLPLITKSGFNLPFRIKINGF